MNNEEFITLHRHYIWCNILKNNFENENQKLIDSNSETDIDTVMSDYYGAYMSIWYGMLFAVLEVFKKKKISMPEIEIDVADIYDSLRLYRNAVFHPQPEYWSPAFFKIMKVKDSVAKIRKVHDHLGRYFLKEMQERRNSIKTPQGH